jgi:hypothetical protein
MAEAAANIPLLLRTAQTLRERFAALRDLGPVVAVMEETPRGPSEGPNPNPGPPDELPFAVGDGQPPRRRLGAVVERDGQIAATRSLWFSAEDPTVSRILRLCRDANGFVPFVRRNYGLAPDCGTTNPQCRWIWTVFELAEIRPPFTVLALGGMGEVFRSGDSGFSVAESFITAAEKSPGTIDPFFEMVRRQTFRPQRYWQLDDLAEASITVMDLIEVAIPSLAGSDRNQAAANDPTSEGPAEIASPADEGSEDTTRRGGRRHKRTVEGLNVNQWVAAMVAGDPSFRHLSQRAAAELGIFSASAIGNCEMWIQMKADLEAEALEAAERAEAELADRQGEEEDGHGLRLSSTKYGTGKQRVSSEDLKHEREVDAFLRSKGEQPNKKRAK